MLVGLARPRPMQVGLEIISEYFQNKMSKDQSIRKLDKNDFAEIRNGCNFRNNHNTVG